MNLIDPLELVSCHDERPSEPKRPLPADTRERFLGVGFGPDGETFTFPVSIIRHSYPLDTGEPPPPYVPSPQLASWRQRLLDLFEEAGEFPELAKTVYDSPLCTTLDDWRSHTESVLVAAGLRWEDEPAGYTFRDADPSRETP